MSAQAHDTVARLLVEIDAVAEGLRHFDMATGLDAGRSQLIQPDLARIDALRGDWDSADRRVATLVADPDVPVMQFGSVIEARLSLWRRDLPRLVAAVSRLPFQFRGQGFDLLGKYERWVKTREFDVGAWLVQFEKLGDPELPQRTQLATFQRTIEASALMEQPEVTEAGLRAASRYGLLDVLWIEHCPLFAPYAATTWMIDVRAEVRERARSVLAAFRAAGG